MTFSKSPHRFDTGFIPTANPASDSIIVTRNSPLISDLSRKGPGQYRIDMGSFIGGGGSREATHGGLSRVDPDCDIAGHPFGEARFSLLA